MSEKELKVRIQHKHDVEANWLKAINFIPLASEIIIYDHVENYDYPRIKIGDNKTNVNALPFVTKDYAKISDIPTKPADIGAQPAGNYLTSIPNEYVTEDELNSKGYLTNYTETDPTVPAWAKASTKPTYNKSEVGLSNVDNIQQYSANNPPVVVRASAPSDTNLLWIDPNENSLAYIPVKGVDFWTEADQESIVQQVMQALATPVYGRVDDENNIIVTASLADGTYTLKYEYADGKLVTIGDVVIGVNYTNLVPTAEAYDSTEPYDGKGYKNGCYLSGSAPYEGSDGATVLTGYMPYTVPATGLPGTIYFSGAEVQAISHCRIYFFGETKVMSGSGVQGTVLSTYYTIENLSNGVTKLTPIASGNTSKLIADSKAQSTTVYFRMSLLGTGENLIITVDEPIV